MESGQIDNLFFQTIVHQCNDFVVITDPDARILYVNPAFEKHTGYTHEFLKEKKISVIKSGAHNDTFYSILWHQLLKGKPVSKVFINKKKNGDLYYENKTITPIRNPAGEICYYLSTSKDITADFKLQKQLRDRNTFIQKVLQNTDALIIGLNPKGNIVLFNKACEKLTGYTAKQVQGKSVFDLFVHQIARSGMTLALQGILKKDSRFSKYESKWLTKNGQYITISWSNTLVEGDEDLVLSTGINVTQEKESEQKLVALNLHLDDKVKERTAEIEELNRAILAQNKKYRSLYENALVGIFSVNIRTQCPVEVNDICASMFGYQSREDFLRNFRSSERYANSEDRVRFLEKFYSKEAVLNEEVLFTRKDGTTFWGNVSVKTDPESSVLEGVVIDVTQRKIYEEQLEKSLNEKDVLLKEIHHRVKNNLQVISSLLKLQSNKIQDNYIKQPLLESIERIKTIALIHEKLYLDQNLSRINFSDYLASMSKPIHSLNTGKEITLSYQMDEFFASIDLSIPLGLACHEIISNVFKHAFSGKNKGELKISINKTEAGDHELLISDNGNGFNINLMNDGRSLGWNLISNLLKQAKADYEVDSRIGEGTTYRILIKNEFKEKNTYC